MLRKLRRSCRITHKGLHAPQLMIALTLMLMLSGLLAPIASTIEAAPASQGSGQTDELASAALQSQNDDDEDDNTSNTLLRPSNNLRVNTSNLQIQQNQTLQPLQPIDQGDQSDDEEVPPDDTPDESDTQTTRPGGFIFNLYWCPDTVDLKNVDAFDFFAIENLKTNCGQQAAPVTVRLTASGLSPIKSDGVSFPATLEFMPLDPNDWTVDVLPHVVVEEDLFNCGGITPYGNTKPYGTMLRSISTQSQYDVESLSEEVITCDWFGKVPDTSSLNITKYNCPEGFDFANQGYNAAIQGACWGAVDPPIEFTVKSTEPGVTFEETRTTDPLNNDEVYFPAIPKGAFDVTEHVPDGYGLIAVYCSVNAGQSQLVDISDGNVWLTKTAGGDAIRCDYFDQPGAGPGTMDRPMGDTPSDGGVSLTIYKWQCPAGTDQTSSDPSYYSAECATQLAEVPFTVTDAIGDHPILSDIDGVQIDNLVPNQDGTLTIVEQTPPGYALPVAFCRALNGDLMQMPIALGGTILYTTADEISYQCNWYNIPTPRVPQGDGSGDVYAYKFGCPAGVPVDADLAWFAANCDTRRDGVTFVLDRQDPEADIQTNTGDRGAGWEGVAAMEGVAAGTYPLSETNDPSGYTLYAAYCQTANRGQDVQGNTWSQMTLSGTTIDVTVQSDMATHCVFFNAPSTDDSGVSLTIYKWLCPAGTDQTSTDPSYYSGECATQLAEIPFTITDAVGDHPIFSAIDGVQTDNLMPNQDGTITIVEQTPSGYAQPIAFCQPLNGELTQMPIALGGTILYTTADEVSYQCNWYNIPTTGGTGDVKIWKWDCGNAFITDSNADATNFDWLRTNCTTPQNDVTFSLGFLTSTTNNGYTEFLGIDPGTYDLTETVPAGYETVAATCGLTSNLTDPADVVYGGLMALSDGTVNIETLADHIVYCQWFNKPVGSGEIQIKKWDCGDAVLPQKADYNWFATNCTTPQDGVTFTVNTDPEKSATTVGGVATITDVPEGNYQLSEQIPDGYASPAVACTLVSKDVPVENLSFALMPKSAGTNNAVDIQVLADHIVYCHWFNMPKHDGDVSLTIYKWLCKPGTNGTQTDQSYYGAECDMEQAGVKFTIIDGRANSPIETTSDTNGRQIDGLVPDANTHITITEEVLSGYKSPVVFCQYVGDDMSQQMMVDNNGVILTVPFESAQIQCFWYNIPDPGSTVHVTKWECPEGTDPSSTLEWFQDNCMTRLSGVNFTLQSGAMSSTLTTDMDGEAKFESVPAGMMTLSESIPMGYSPNPVVVCSGTVYVNGAIGDMFPNFVSAPGGSWTFNMTEGQWTIHCDFYNIPEKPSTVYIYKWSCPEGMTPEPTIQWHQDNCTMTMDGVEFTLTDAVGPRTLATSGGMVTFNDVATGPLQIKETIPAGYSNQPFLVCQFTYYDGTGTVQLTPGTVNGVYNTNMEKPGELRCDWYNHKVGPGEITVYKWTCPEGYDRTAWGANPMTDCTQATNGITFRLIQPAPMPELQSNTGDSISGAVYFGGLQPGTYILNELLTPDQSMNLKEAFIWQCYGLTTSSVQPYPLNIGQMFQFDIVGGDTIICHWFNVPKTPHGWIDVSKFNCTTEKYVADVYCYTNQTGQEFNLQKFDGTNWNTIASGITDVNGKLSFPGLDEGDYRLVEPNKDACMIKSSNITPNKNIGVKKGEGTTVYVYNCKTPPPPNDTPKKYPNTGVDPESAASVQRTPGVEAAGLLGLAGLSLSRRRFLKRAAGVTLGAGALALPAVAAQDLLPLDSTPVPATPGANVLGCGTPTAMTDDAIIEPINEGTPTWEDPCLRGPVPLRFRVPIIGVDAAVEYLEIIDGQMQPPSGADDVTWYKETSRLGEVGNGIYAGHLNYWGIPEGVFFRLESLKQGDVIEIDGIDAKTYSYIVQWSQNFPSDEEPPEEALGTTNERAITVITCGGEWVSSRAEYDHRTLVRAVQMEDPV